MKLTILGGGGMRMPAFVHALLSGPAPPFDQICLLEPDRLRRETIGRLAVEVAAALGFPGLVGLTDAVDDGLAMADFVLCAIRVGGDRGRVIDEQVALRHGLVGQETTGAGGCAMALRTIPVVLSYCELASRIAPGATLINLTNPAGLITQAIARQGLVQVVGVCDTPAATAGHLAAFLGADPAAATVGYSGLNHLGWVTSVQVDGRERMDDLLGRFEELQASDHRFAAFDPALVRRVGAIPTEYVYFYYDPQRYVRSVAAAGTSRGQDVERLNYALITSVARAFADGGLDEAWPAYARLMAVRRDTYMRADMGAGGGPAAALAGVQAGQPLPAEAGAKAAAEATAAAVGGYEGMAVRVIDGLTGASPAPLILNRRNDTTIPALEADDIVEAPTRVSEAGLVPEPTPELHRSARALVEQVKEYERATVEAAVTGDARLAAVALTLHPLVPGTAAAGELLADYREQHADALAYLR